MATLYFATHSLIVSVPWALHEVKAAKTRCMHCDTHSKRRGQIPDKADATRKLSGLLSLGFLCTAILISTEDRISDESKYSGPGFQVTISPLAVEAPYEGIETWLETSTEYMVRLMAIAEMVPGIMQQRSFTCIAPRELTPSL